MGCTASTPKGPDAAASCVAFNNKEVDANHFSTPQKERENSDSCPFCEFDDEFREVRRSRTETTETLQSSSASTNTSQRITIDTPYIGDDENFIVLRKSVGDESVLKNFAEVQRLSQRTPTLCTEAILFGTQPLAAESEDQEGPYTFHVSEEYEEERNSDAERSSKSPRSENNSGIVPKFTTTILRSNSDAERRGNFVPFSSMKSLSSDDIEIVHRDDDSRERVRTFVNKIEEETLERKIFVSPLKIDTEQQGANGRGGRYLGVRSKSMSSGMEPLSPTKYAPRSIASVGKLSREKFTIGDFQDFGHVKTIVEKLQSPTSRGNNNLNGFFKPMLSRSSSRRVPQSPLSMVLVKCDNASDSGEGETENDNSSFEGGGGNDHHLNGSPRAYSEISDCNSPSAKLQHGGQSSSVKKIVENWGPAKESVPSDIRSLTSVKSKRNFSLSTFESIEA